MENNIIKTERLVLRPIEESDLDAVHEYAGDREITMMMFLPNETIGETEKFIRESVEGWKSESPRDREFVITHEGIVAGGINLAAYDEAGLFEIGWIVNRKYRGMGFAQEAARGLAEYAFRKLGARKLIAHCDSRNKASERVMLKIGMKLKDANGTRIYPKTGIASGEYLYELDGEEYCGKEPATGSGK